MDSAIRLCSRALLSLGCGSIASFDDGSAEAEVAGMLYPGTRDALLSSHPWSFATGQATLAPLAATPVADFQSAYQLPPDFLRALSVGSTQSGSSRGVTYRILERRIHTDAGPSLALSYIYRAHEEAWPAFFDAALVAALAYEFCLPLTENSSRADLSARKAEMEARRARLIDSQQQTPLRIEDDTFIRVRG